MKWIDALKQAVKSIGRLNNRQAAGLVNFARRTVSTFGKTHDVPAFDWYAFALPVLGYSKLGDKFKIDTAWQLQTLPEAHENAIASALTSLANALDGQGVPFRAVVDPRGTDAIFRALAKDAWAVMQRLRKEGKDESGKDDSAKTITLDPIDKAPAEQLPLPGVEAPTSTSSTSSAAPTSPASTSSAPSTSLVPTIKPAKAKALARAALEKYVAGADHKRWFLWAIRASDSTPLVREGDSERDVADAFGSFGLSSSAFGDLSDVVYGAYWDTAATPIKPAAEYGGQLEVKPDAEKKGGGGAILLLLLVLASGGKRSRR